VIRQNALRLLAALSEFLDRFAGPRAANLACRVEARVEHGVSREAVALTAIEGVGSGRAGAARRRRDSPRPRTSSTPARADWRPPV